MNPQNNRQQYNAKPPNNNAYAQTLPVNKKPTYILIIIKLCLLALAVIMMTLFISMIFVDLTPAYVKTIPATRDQPELALLPSDGVSESDIPKPPEPEIPIDEPLIYDFSQPVPEGDEYPIEYFNNTVFIGDSRALGFVTYTKISPLNYSSVGLSIGGLTSKPYLRYNDNGEFININCMEALEIEKDKYHTIFMALGINDLGWDVKAFINTYRKQIAAIREITDATIYIQLILPVTAEYGANSKFGITSEKAALFNEKLRELAAELEVYMLDPTELFMLEDGTLDPEDTLDGAHLTTAAYNELLDYYRTHIVDPSKYENLRDKDAVEFTQP
ncbi:MAG: hypothetical protein HFE63_09730 [Clostridiales bacterium]|nr:hypothetical protein [Clostridiales bacterium]